MTIAKTMSDEQLAFIASEVSQAYKSFVKAWDLGMKVMPLKSREYRAICAAGKKIGKAYIVLETEAMRREWTGDQFRDVFNRNGRCCFN